MEPFDGLQQGLRERRPGLRLFAPGEGTIVVLPSLTLPGEVLRRLTGIQHYEERMLWMLLTLADPGVKVVYLSSLPSDPAIVDYYLQFLPDPERARARLFTVDLADPSPTPLSSKLLSRPDVLDRVGALVAELGDGWVQPYIVTPLERAFAERVGLPLFGPHPDLAYLGSKSGARHLARAAGVPVPAGVEDLRSVQDVDGAVDALRGATSPRRVVVKLNDSSSGLGNAVVDLGPAGESVVDAATRFTTEGESWPSFGDKIAERGAVAEELLEHEALVSPSVQVEVTPKGTWHVLGTHVQNLGGANGQTYLGCRFPAGIGYRERIQQRAEQVAERMADRGVMGLFGIDFLVIPDAEGQDEAYLAEINLRFGGTTHPLGMVTLTTGATYDRPSGNLHARGRPKFYVATDNVVREHLIGTSPADVVVMLQKAGLALDQGSGTGVTLHMLGALPVFGKLGFTCVGDSPQEAEELYVEMLRLLERWHPARR